MKIPSDLYFDRVDPSKPYEPLALSKSAWKHVDPEPVRACDIVATEVEFDRDTMVRVPGHEKDLPKIICLDGNAYLVSDHGPVAWLIREGAEILHCLVMPVARAAKIPVRH